MMIPGILIPRKVERILIAMWYVQQQLAYKSLCFRTCILVGGRGRWQAGTRKLYHAGGTQNGMCGPLLYSNFLLSRLSSDSLLN